MAILTESNRQALFQKLMSDSSSRRESLGALTKAEFRIAVDAIDQWVDDNAVDFNSAIPLPARTELTAKQKAEMLMMIVSKRWEVS